VGGVLLVSSHSGNPMAERLEKAGVPVVACGEPLGQSRAIAYVAVDERGGAHQMVRHLAGSGRRRIAMITGPLDTPGGVQRLAGYREELAAAGLEADERLVAEGDYSRASARRPWPPSSSTPPTSTPSSSPRTSWPRAHSRPSTTRPPRPRRRRRRRSTTPPPLGPGPLTTIRQPGPA